MEELLKMYAAIEQLEQLGLPMSAEQRQRVAEMENLYVENCLIPLVKEKTEPLFRGIRSNVNLTFHFDIENGLTVKNASVKEKRTVKQDQNREKVFHRSGVKFIIRVVYPDGRETCHGKVVDTLKDVVLYAGVDRVFDLKLRIGGPTLVSRERFQNVLDQRDLGNGYYLYVHTNSDVKFRQIEMLNETLHLGLKIEKQLLI